MTVCADGTTAAVNTVRVLSIGRFKSISTPNAIAGQIKLSLMQSFAVVVTYLGLHVVACAYVTFVRFLYNASFYLDKI